MIQFNKPYLSGKELEYIKDAVESGKISGDGIYTKKCHDFFQDNFGFKKCLLTTSCTDALEMASLLINIKKGDEVIIPSYTFVSSANPFVMRGAKVVFADSMDDNPNIDPSKIESLITKKTVAIVVVHYAGISCRMDEIVELASKYKLYIIEDAAQAIDSYYIGKDKIKKRLGTIGHFGVFSFHETKNIQCGEGGMMVINDNSFNLRAEIIREKGTNRSAFFRGEIDKYSWVDIGSSFLPSDIIAAFLYAQLEVLNDIQSKRKKIWNTYYASLHHLQVRGLIRLPSVPDYATNNAHLFYILCNDIGQRDRLIAHLKKNNVYAVFHYLALHKSSFYSANHDGRHLVNCDNFSDVLLRLPLFYELTESQQFNVIRFVESFFDLEGQEKTFFLV
jgi:dTDP-4-amino-4,6-dideoxygalactose transaminase